MDNVLVLQSGGCTPVLNQSLLGVVQEASQHREFGSIYGAAHGLEGLLAEDLIDLQRLSRSAWLRIGRTPGAALGSTRRKLREDDVSPIMEVLGRHGVRFLFIIGGNDSAETGLSLADAAAQSAYPLTVVNVPKTIDNDLVLTDHSPGYGTTARFVALATIGAGQDARSMGQASPITIIEVMGRDTGWLAAASALARREEGDAPHLICLPEVPITEKQFVERVEQAYRQYGFAVAVIAENTRSPQGVLGGDAEPWFVDDFGHPYHDSPARYLAGRVTQALKVRARYERPGTIQRAFMGCVSRTDTREAAEAGRAAVRYALAGHNREIVTLERLPGEKYSCTTASASLDKVAGKVKTIPREYLDFDNWYVTPAFLRYARPLIGSPLPAFGKIRRGGG